MIDALQDGNYTLTGESTRHRSLQDLVDFHSRTPIMPFNEALTVPCIKVRKTRNACNHISLIDFNAILPLWRLRFSLILPSVFQSLPMPLKISEDTERDDDIPPALPHRTALPAIPTLLTPPYHTDLPPNGFNSHPPDQGSHYELWLQPPVINAIVSLCKPSLVWFIENVFPFYAS